MKKNIISLILIFSIMYTLSISTSANELYPIMSQTSDGYTTFLYSDGSKLTISPAEYDYTNKATYTSTNTVTKHKNAYFTDSSGNLEWEYTLYATFSYVEGVSATCTNTYYTQNIYENGWSFSDGAATASGNAARGTGTFVKKFLFITTKTYNIDISLTCDIYGNVT